MKLQTTSPRHIVLTSYRRQKPQNSIDLIPVQASLSTHHNYLQALEDPNLKSFIKSK